MLAHPLSLGYQKADWSEIEKASVAAEMTDNLTSESPKSGGLVCAGIPDDGAVGAHLTEEFQPSFHFPNLLELPAAARAEIDGRNAINWFPLARKHEAVSPAFAINICAHLDAYSRALTAIDDEFGTSLPVFNHPRGVAMARRDVASLRLAETDLLAIPKLIHFRPRQTDAFQEAFATARFRYPVEVQPTTSRDRQDRLRISDPDDWRKLLVGDWSGRWYFMTQLAANATAGETRLRLCVTGRQWAARSYRDDGGAPGQPDGLDATLRQVVAAVMRLMPLDFWSMDLRLRPDGKLVLQDVSVGMTAPAPGRGLDPMRRATVALWTQAEPQLAQLLGAPKQWRRAPGEDYCPRAVLTRFGGRQPADMGERALN